MGFTNRYVYEEIRLCCNVIEPHFDLVLYQDDVPHIWIVREGGGSDLVMIVLYGSLVYL